MKKLIMILCSLSLLIGTAQGQNAQNGATAGGNATGGPRVDVPPSPPEMMHPGEPGVEIPEEVLALHAEVKTLRDALRESRNAALEALGEDASREQKAAALALWHEQNITDIESMQELSEDLRALIQEYRPEGVGIDIPEEIVALRDDLKTKRQALADSRREVILALGEDPTDEAVQAAIEAWREANADAIAEVKDLASELRDWFRENRPERPGMGRTPGMAQRRAAFRDNVSNMRDNRQDLRLQLQDPTLTQEERDAIIATFRADQMELMQERKTLKRQERINQGGVGGDRRPGG